MLIIPRCAVQALFDAILAGLLACVRDHNGRVQEAACSGLAEVLEHAGHCTQGAILVPRFQVGWCGWGVITSGTGAALPGRGRCGG